MSNILSSDNDKLSDYSSTMNAYKALDEEKSKAEQKKRRNKDNARKREKRQVKHYELITAKEEAINNATYGHSNTYLSDLSDELRTATIKEIKKFKNLEILKLLNKYFNGVDEEYYYGWIHYCNVLTRLARLKLSDKNFSKRLKYLQKKGERNLPYPQSFYTDNLYGNYTYDNGITILGIDSSDANIIVKEIKAKILSHIRFNQKIKSIFKKRP
ncbi:MAG: hypothetical protein LBP40_02665 [Campylobacteraceae bacterium]|nr:hypothetical protein [Campylobacteraceae bacterium]